MATFTELYADQGTDFTFSIDLDSDPDLTGYVTESSIQKTRGFGCDLDLSFDIVIGSAEAELTASLTSAVTDTMEEGRYYFTINIISAANIKTRALEGFLYISAKA